MKLKASGRPVNPPIPNIGKKAEANSIWVLNRIDPPQSVIIKQVSRITDGTEISTVVIWKNVDIMTPIPVRYM